MQSTDTETREKKLIRLYWLTRIGIATIWIWTAVASWFIYPHPASLNWLRQLGLTYQTGFWFSAACLLDAGLGIASALFASRLLWQSQILLVIFYTLAVSLGLPEFLAHPFGPIAKNLAVLCCLVYLAIMERR